MVKKSVSAESYGPYYDTYIKIDREGVEWEQEIPCYREVSTSHGTFGVPKRHKLTFKTEDTKDGPAIVPVYTEVKSSKARKPKTAAVSTTTDIEE
jgi:hypothetical protein